MLIWIFYVCIYWEDTFSFVIAHLVLDEQHAKNVLYKIM